MIRTSGYIISVAIMLLVCPAASQTGTPQSPGGSDSDTLGTGPGNGLVQDDPLFGDADIIPEDYFPGLRIGVNISKPLWTYAEPSRFGMEAMADFNIDHEYFAVAEAGFSMRDLEEPGYQLKEWGMYLRVGGDRNFYRQFNDVIGVGARLGFALYDREASLVTVEPDYWGEYRGELAGDTFFRQWAEVLVVLKTEIFTNVYLGWNLRGKLLFFDKGDKYMEERYIPGFGLATTRSTGGFDFYLSYRFPVGR